MNGKTDNIGCFTGEGVVTNFTAPMPCRLQGRTLTFSGYAYGTAGGSITVRSAGTFVLGGANTLEQVGYSDTEVTGTLLGFAPGIVNFGIGWLDSINPITLESQDGKPIQLALGTAARTSSIKADVNGKGGLTVAGPASLTVLADTSYAGPTIVKGSTLTVGDGATYNGAITNSSCITIMSGRALNIENKDAMTYPNSITGLGNINKNRSSEIALGSLDMQGGQLNINSGSATISGGSSSNLAIRVDKGLGLVVNGGHFIDSSISVVSEGALSGNTSITLNQGSSRNLAYNNNNLLSALNVTGGDWHFSSDFGANSQRNFMYTQSGGKANFNVSRGMNNTNRVYGVVSGGELNIRFVNPPRGLGLKVAGDGRVTMEGTQRLASDGWSHDLILTNNALVDGSTIQLMSKGTSGSDSRVELSGGTLAFNALDNNAGNCDVDNTIQFNFNGGILRPKVNTTTYDNPLYSTFSVLDGGARIDVAASGQYAFQPTLYSGVFGREDGGLIKSGIGRLDLSNHMRYTGKTVVRDGLLRTLSKDAQPLGSNTVHIEHGEIRVQSGSTGSELLVQKFANAAPADSLSFGGGVASLSLHKPTAGTLTLEIGHPSATPDSALNRVDHGVLLVAPFGGLGAANFGVNEKIIANGGLNTTSGMVTPSILGIIWGGSSWYSGSFLNYNGVNGLIDATYTTGLGGGASSLATLSADTATGSVHVHGLRLTGADLTVNSGETLTIGDGVNPAGLILNRDSAGRSALLGGTLDFQSSEGIIYIDNYNAPGHTISSTITGDNGLTIAGYGNSEILNLTAPAGNTYLGDTHILNGRVTLASPQGFSSGDLYIYGSDLVGGCFLFNFAGTITNPMHLAGVGGPLYYVHGAVTFLNENEGVIDAPVELMRTARVGADGVASSGRFSQPITGTGDLEINTHRADRPSGTIIFGAQNSYQGRTVINQGTLQVDEGGTLGIGDVVNCGTLLFDNSSARTVTNKIEGSGVVKKVGSGALTLAGAVACDIEVVAGSVVLASNAVSPQVGISGIMDVNGQSITINSLSGIGSITNSNAASAALNLDVAAGSESIYWGSINDGGNIIDLNKDGAGTLVLGGSNSYQGATTISEGTVKLSASVGKVPYRSDLAYQLDASTPDTVTLSGANVVAWADSSGNNNHFVQEIGDAYNQYPSYVSDAINGKGAVRFDGNWNRLYATNVVDNQTVLIVNNKTGQMNLSGIWGSKGADFGVRAASAAMWQDGDKNDFARGASFYVNGVNTRSYIQGTPHVLAATSVAVRKFAGAVGDYWGHVTEHRSYIGDIGEVLVYKTALSNSQREVVERYLNLKWFGSTQSTVLTNVLPQTTALVIEKNGVLDLAGSVQAVASLRGDGHVLSSATGAAELRVGLDNRDTTFGGSISDLALFNKAGSGMLTLTGVSSFTGETIVSGGTLRLSGGANRLNPASSATVESNAVFDVSYLPQTLAAIAGSGTVMDCDGLIVTGSVAPGGVGTVGTLTFDGSPSLAGNYSFTAGPGSADCINVQGNIDISSLALRIEDPEKLTALSYTILQCSGALSGTFTSDDLPSSWSINYDYDVGVVTLHRLVGTLMILR